MKKINSLRTRILLSLITCAVVYAPKVSAQTTIENPIKITTLDGFIKGILDIFLTIGVPIVVFFIIYSGFLFVKARGNPSELTKAKETLQYTLIGAAILLGSWVLANAVAGTINQLR